ncbi:MAG: hypothetical protein RMI01_08910 [Thermodesulfovibrio sp.]|nr:hypothetical protein [Thermodesulfovibrio sp.]
MPIIPLFNIHFGSTFPSNATPVRGTLWFNSTDNTLRIFDGANWTSIYSGGINILQPSISLVTNASYTINLSSDFLVIINAANTNVTVNIPQGVDGKTIILKRIDNNSSRTVTVNGQIDSVSSITLDPQEYKWLVYYSGAWRVIGS